MTMDDAPLLSPRQMNFLRAVAAMAWADGVLEPQEVTTLTDYLTPLFCRTNEVGTVRSQVAQFLLQNIPLAETLPRISSPLDQVLLLKLAYIIIHVSRRSPEEPLVNSEEASAYERLRQMINLSPELMDHAEAEARLQLSLEGYLNEVARILG